MKQGHLFIAVNCAEFRGTATSQKREFRGHFAAKIDNFAVISRQNLSNFVIISRLNSQILWADGPLGTCQFYLVN